MAPRPAPFPVDGGLPAGEIPLGQGDKIDESFYRDRVRPLLDLKCIACHGPLRSEAGLRLDAAERIHRGSDEARSSIWPTLPKASSFNAFNRPIPIPGCPRR